MYSNFNISRLSSAFHEGVLDRLELTGSLEPFHQKQQRSRDGFAGDLAQPKVVEFINSSFGVELANDVITISGRVPID